MVNSNSDGTATRPLNGDRGGADGFPSRFWLHNDITALDDSSEVPPSAGLVTLGYLWSAVRRRVRLWVPLAILGLVVGTGLYVRFPPSYQASASVLLTYGPNQNPEYQIYTDAAVATSTEVASRAIHQLGLQQSVASFLADYVVTEPTDQLLLITVNAPSSASAVQRANAIDSAFLAVNASYAQTQESQLEASLNDQVTTASQHLNSINGQISQLSSQTPLTPTQQTRLTSLENQRTLAENALAQMRQSVTGTVLTDRAATQAEISQTQVIDAPTAVHHSRIKGSVLYVGGGLVGGLALGLGIVIIGALVTNRLRRRDDVAYAIGAPVRLSVGSAGDSGSDLERVVDHLDHVVLAGTGAGPSSLAVVATSDTGTAARAVLSLADRTKGSILVADLSKDRSAAAALGVTTPGVHQVKTDEHELTLFVPAVGDPKPAGPLRGDADGELAAAAADATAILSLATLDPSYGGDYLATWANDAVAIVTAGKSSAEVIRSEGEMIRLSGVTLRSVVLTRADRGDESLGSWGPSATTVA